MSAKPGYQELMAWQKAMSLVKQIYFVTRFLPEEERFGLVSQLRRAAVSVPSNIAEGHGRMQSRDFVRFLDMARGSANEVETQLLVIEMLDYLPREKIAEALAATDEVQRLIKGLAKHILNRHT